MAFFDLVWYIHAGDGATTGYYGIPVWQANHLYNCGQLVRPATAPAAGNERVYVASFAAANATSGPTEPTWTFTRGIRIGDGTGNLVWQECTGAAALNGDIFNAPNWNSAFLGSKAITLGQVITDSAQTYVFIASNAATNAAAEPAWVKSAGSNTVSGSQIWTCLGPVGNFTAFAAPHARFTSAVAVNWGIAGNDFFIADNSAELSAATLSLNAGTTTTPCRVFSVDHTSTQPWTAAALKPGAKITSSAASANAVAVGNGSLSSSYWYGVTFNATGALAGATVSVGSSGVGSVMQLEACTFQLSGASISGGVIVIGGGSQVNSQVDLINCNLSFNNTGQMCALGGCNLTWRNTPHPFLAAGSTVPTFVFRFYPANPGTHLFEGVDFTSLAGAVLFSAAFSGGLQTTLKNCKMHSASNIITAITPAQPVINIDLVNCDIGTNIARSERFNLNGSLNTDTSITRQGGATSGGIGVSHRVLANANARQWKPFNAVPLMVWNEVTGSPVTVTLYGISFTSNFIWNDAVWMDVEYMGSSGSPIASVASTGIASPLLAASHVLVTTDTSSLWCQGAALRLNSTAYVAGQVFRVASNPTRIFFPSGAGGTTAASEPAWYATANDGDHAADGTIANVVCGQRFKLAVTVTPQQRGYITAYPRSTFAITQYFDPQLVLS